MPTSASTPPDAGRAATIGQLVQSTPDLSTLATAVQVSQLSEHFWTSPSQNITGSVRASCTLACVVRWSS